MGCAHKILFGVPMARRTLLYYAEVIPCESVCASIFVFSFALTATADSAFQSKMNSTRLSNLLNFHSNRSGEVSVGGGHDGRHAVVLLTTDGTALACGFNDRLGPLPYLKRM